MRDVALEEAGVQPTPQGWGPGPGAEAAPKQAGARQPPPPRARSRRPPGTGEEGSVPSPSCFWGPARWQGHPARPSPPAASCSPVGADTDVVHVELDGLGLLLVLEVVIGQEVVELVDHWRGGIGPFGEAGHLAGERASMRG